MNKLHRLFSRAHWLVNSKHCISNWNYVKYKVPESHPQVDKLYDGIICGERAALAKGITLVESLNPKKKAMGEALLVKLIRHMKEKEKEKKEFTFRIGLSGSPGAGKSTLIETFGTRLIEKGHSVAVLTVDPSSVSSGGSILGDKTRMWKLSQNDKAYIRQSPSKCTLGGVTRSTNEAVRLCEGAGYDIILIETVGVGQSEIAVTNMVDMFCVVVPPAAGDELQGLKKGIIEVADLVVVNKADGDLMPAARRAAAEYTSALKLMRRKTEHWNPSVMKVSSLTGDGVDKLWGIMSSFHQKMIDNGELESRRHRQRVVWMWNHAHDQLVDLFQSHPSVQQQRADLERQVHNGHLSPGFAADLLLNDFFCTSGDN